MNESVWFSDLVVADIAARICIHEPERGGALLAAGDVIHYLVDDIDGRYTGVSWDISPNLTTEVQLAESAGRGRLAATIHSHPAGVPRSVQSRSRAPPHGCSTPTTTSTASRCASSPKGRHASSTSPSATGTA